MKLVKYNPDSSDIARMGKALYDYNEELEAPHYKRLSKAFKFVDDNNQIIAEAAVDISFHRLKLKLLYVSKGFRSKGFGKKLMLEVEKFAKEHECSIIVAWTTSWQGEGFYELCGFKEMYKLPLNTEDKFNNKPQSYILYIKDLYT